MADIKKVIETLDTAVAGYEKVVTKSQKKIYEEAITLLHDLDLKNGRVAQSIANLKRLNAIKAKLKAVSNNSEYLAGLGKFVSYFDALAREQREYFTQEFAEAALDKNVDREKRELIHKQAKDNTIAALAGDGLAANVTGRLSDMLTRAVTSGVKFSDLTKELHSYLQGEDGGQGALARYATTYATTAISQFTGQNNKIMTEGVDTDWFMYVGSTMETTREFCDCLVAKRYINRKEFHKILSGNIDGHQCKMYDKTGLPVGMIAGTNEENFQVNCGGWNCRHQLVPVHELAVPADVRARFEREYKKNNGDVESMHHDDYKMWMHDHKEIYRQAVVLADFAGVNSRLEDVGMSYSELDDAFKELNRSVMLALRNEENTKIAQRLITEGYQDVQINKEGGLLAKSPDHAEHKNDRVTYFEGLTGDMLESECANEIFRLGNRIILRPEGIIGDDGNQMRELDAIVNGRLMDIASVTENGPKTIRNIIKKKHNQLDTFNKQHNANADSLCIYFHNPSWYSEQKVRESYNEFLIWAHIESTPIKYIYVVLKGGNNIIKIRL